MPIEIKELIVRATIRDGEGGSANDKAEIVRECVEQVMQLLQDRNER